MSGSDSPELWYFADPMCSWCWGFSPVIAAIAERVAGQVPLRVFAGGLAPGTSEPWSAAMRAEIRQHWEHVAEASGQPFDHAWFDRDGFVYDTEPACRAVVAARDLDPARALPMLARLHRGFYAEAVDVTDVDALAGLAADEGFDRDLFRDALRSDEIAARTTEDFVMSRQIGVRGYPTLVGRGGGRLVALTVGYQPLERMAPIVDEWMEAVCAA